MSSVHRLVSFLPGPDGCFCPLFYLIFPSTSLSVSHSFILSSHLHLCLSLTVFPFSIVFENLLCLFKLFSFLDPYFFLKIHSALEFFQIFLYLFISFFLIYTTCSYRTTSLLHSSFSPIFYESRFLLHTVIQNI